MRVLLLQENKTCTILLKTIFFKICLILHNSTAFLIYLFYCNWTNKSMIIFVFEMSLEFHVRNNWHWKQPWSKKRKCHSSYYSHSANILQGEIRRHMKYSPLFPRMVEMLMRIYARIFTCFNYMSFLTFIFGRF